MKKGMLIRQSANSAFSREQRGFTLVEVVLVLVIVSILDAVVISRNNPAAARTKLLGEVELLKTQLRYAQARSLNANEVWGMAADNSNNLWLFRGGDDTNRAALPGEAATTVDYDSDDRKSGLGINQFRVSFDDLGRPCTDAAGTALAAAAITVTLNDTINSTTAQFTITPNTGFIQ